MQKWIFEIPLSKLDSYIFENKLTVFRPNTAAKLSVGARALSKHCHRDQTMSWWGDCTGSK